MKEDKINIDITSPFHDYIFSGDIKLLYFLILLMVLDIFTGVIKAIKNKELRSRKSMFGFAKKMLVFCIIILSNVIDVLLDLNGGLLLITTLFYIANEGLSIVENCAEMGVLVPKEISDRLKVIQNKGDDPHGNDQSRKDR